MTLKPTPREPGLASEKPKRLNRPFSFGICTVLRGQPAAKNNTHSSQPGIYFRRWLDTRVVSRKNERMCIWSIPRICLHSVSAGFADRSDPDSAGCRWVVRQAASLSSDSGTCDRPPEVSLTASRAQPPDLRSVSLMDLDFAVNGQLVRHSRLISDFCSSAHVCSTLLSPDASRLRPCASLILHLHQAG